MNMLELSDDCLAGIFVRLRFIEQLSLTRVCKRFEEIICVRIWKESFTKLNTHHFHNELPCKYRTRFIHLIAANLERLTICRWAGVADDFYGLDASKFLQRSMRNLVYLQFRGNRISLTDMHMQLVAKFCPNLKVLYVSDRRITGTHIESMRNVEELYAPHCAIDAKHLRLIFFNLKLKRLNLAYNAHNIESVFYNASMSQLQYLQLSDAVLYGIQLAEYLSLREMVVNNTASKLLVRHGSLELKHYTNFLRRLKVYETNVPQLTKSLELALSGAKNLKQIGLLHDDSAELFAEILDKCAHLEVVQLKLFKCELQCAGSIVQKLEKKWQRLTRSTVHSKKLNVQVLYPDKVEANMQAALIGLMYDNFNEVRLTPEYKVVTSFHRFDDISAKLYNDYKIDLDQKEYYVKYVFN